MNKIADILRECSITLWVGGLWIVGFMVAPLLFSTLAENRALAGALAGAMFKGIAWVGIACGSFLLLYELFSARAASLKRLAFWLVLMMLAITIIMQFWLQPFVIALRAMGAPVETLAFPALRSFAFWHGISSVLYLLQGMLGLALVLKSC
jgi:hypothetical protein